MRRPWPQLSFHAKTLTQTPPHRLRRFSAGAGADEVTGIAVNKVTRSNFEPALEILRDRVKAADFVAVDLEMTGVTSAPWREAFEFDRSDVRYLKVKDSAEKFAVVQVGVCPFRWDPSKGSFVAYPHNFYIFPRKELSSYGPSDEFLCQTSSMNFLARYQFDFNSCIHQGISYLSRAQETEAMNDLSSSYSNGLVYSFSKMEDNVEVPIASTFDLLFSERMKNKFKEWCETILHNPDKVGTCKGNPDSKMHFETSFFKMRPIVMLNGFSSHQLKLIQLVLRKHFNNLVYIRGIDEKTTLQARVVYIDTEDDKASLLREVQEDLGRIVRTRIQSAVGFRHVIDILVSEGKLIVGHNCFLDMAHIYNKFMGPLPLSMEDFVLSLNKKFPLIIDTKHILASSQELQLLMKKKSRSLSSVFSQLCPKVSSLTKNISSNFFVKVEVDTDEIGSSSFNSGAKHEAGYDAFMTGCVFAQSCSILGIKFDKQTSLVDLASNKKIKNFVNFLCPSWSSGTVVNLSTGAESLISSYNRKYPTLLFANTAVIWGFPSKITPKDMKDFLCKAFGLNSVTSVLYLDSTAALVQFSEEKLVDEFLILKDTLERKNDPISVLHPLAKLLEGGKTFAAKYDTYRDICSAAPSKVLFADQAEAAGINWKIKLANGNSRSKESTSCGDRAIEDSATELVGGTKSDSLRNLKQQLSYEEILGSLQASQQSHVKQITST